MIKVKNILGFKKHFLNFKIKITVFFYFLPKVFIGKISIKKFILFLKKLLFFLSKLQHNKFVKIGKFSRLGLYIPGFASKAFFTVCKKFLTFNEKLPNTTALISITSSCRFNCEHCYQKYDLGKDIDINLLIPVIKYLQNLGVAFFNIEGGDPFLKFERLKKVCEAIDSRSEIWVNSTGDGVNIEKLKILKKLNITAIMFSLHSPISDKLNQFMKSDLAWKKMAEGIKMCHEIGIPIAFNTCLKKDDFKNGLFDEIMEKTMNFGASIIQLIKPKSAGGWLKSTEPQFSKDDLDFIKQKVHFYNQKKDFPSISAQIIEEDKNMFGCTAGGTDRFYINAKGDVQPCEFLNISYGNIQEEKFSLIYERMRKSFEIPGECWLCEKYSKDILKIFEENQLKSFPLNSNLSKEIYSNWNRGNYTELYKKIDSKNKVKKNKNY